MNINNKLRRLYILVNQLRRRPSTGKELMKLFSEHSLDIEIATFERDKKTLKEDFGIELFYNHSNKTYSIETYDHEIASQVIQFLQFNQLSTTLNKSLSQGKSSLAYVDFENEYQLNGIEYLDRLFMATRHHQVIQILHRKFDNEDAKEFTLHPYLLKQYQSRWYVIANTLKGNTISLGIDRIEKLEVLQKKFTPKSINYKENFKSCIGVSHFQNKRELISIAFDRSQKGYLDNLPLHHSQKLIKDDQHTVVYEYYLVINFELRQHILKYGTLAKVLKPTILAEQIKSELEKAFNAY
ncbi:helix-turn-helix transcriptional regulator [Psychroflexus halocasei]|uniref:Predicted DNA-binding transcriptional regulator YafY, contains an HTH and WYL domains n=1 Tax=Psychroflexus halocasei TaxID=908615 RepID=A0A1H3VFX0_9FLAO|nr:WYL domain-containing protein [Psychroflexus halocasei]SDZ73124.1 Predicted DNA-binding transcriptional regulator YafY, contains an HTH and WYL domains [Psychroflexus halocasei]